MQQAKTSAPETAAVQRIFNTATVTVGGLYLTTHSVTVTAIGTAAATIVECWSIWLNQGRLDTTSDSTEWCRSGCSTTS